MPIQPLPRDNADYYANMALTKDSDIATLRKKRKLFVDEYRQQLNAVEYAEHMQDIVVDYETIYCSHTGQPIGRLDREGISAALVLHDNSEEIKDWYAYNDTTPIDVFLTPSLKWLVQDPERLDKLQYTDPYGYYMYVIGLLCRLNNEDYAKNQWQRPSARREYNIALIQGYQLLGKTDIDEVLLANDRLTKILKYLSVSAGDIEPFGTDPLAWATPNMVSYLPALAHGVLSGLIKKHNKLPSHWSSDPKYGLSHINSPARDSMSTMSVDAKVVDAIIDELLANNEVEVEGNKTTPTGVGTSYPVDNDSTPATPSPQTTTLLDLLNKGANK